MEVVTDPLFLEDVLYIKLTSHVSISVFPQMNLCVTSEMVRP